MKKIIHIYTLLFSAIVLNAQIQEQTFNATTLPSGWAATSSPSNCQWQFGYTGDLPGSGFQTQASFPSGGAVFTDDGCEDDGYTVTLTGPVVNLVSAGVTSAAVEVIYNHQTFSNDGKFTVQVWGGSSWVNILVVDGDMPAPNTGENQTSTIDVTPYINAAFRIRFVYDDENSLTWGVGIDNYRLLDTATAHIEDLLSSGFSYSPNPITENTLRLSANEEISSVIVYNLIGQQVFAGRPKNTSYQVQMSGFPPGIYVVNVSIGEKEGSFKVIKK